MFVLAVIFKEEYLIDLFVSASGPRSHDNYTTFAQFSEKNVLFAIAANPHQSFHHSQRVAGEMLIKFKHAHQMNNLSHFTCDQEQEV